MISLLVVQNFLSYVKGDIITDAKLVKQYLASEWQNYVMQVATALPST